MTDLQELLHASNIIKMVRDMEIKDIHDKVNAQTSLEKAEIIINKLLEKQNG